MPDSRGKICFVYGHSRAAATLTLIVFLTIVLVGRAQAETSFLSLEGVHPFTAEGDDPRFRDLHFDDSHWQRISVPSGWTAAGISAHPDTGTYRIHFELPEGWNVTKPAIRLGIVNRADEVFLNGVRIGGEGRVGQLGSLWHDIPPVMPRLYPFDTSLLKHSGDNVLTVRIGRFPYIDEGGFFNGPVALVDYTDALPEVSAQLQRFAGIDLFVFGIESLILAVALMAFIFGMRDRVMTFFLLLYMSYFLTVLRDQHFFYDLGFSSEWFTLISVKAAGLMWVPLIEFCAAILNRPVGRLGRLLQAATLLDVCIGLPLGVGHPITALYILSPLVWVAIMVPAFVLLTYWAAVAVWRRQSNGVPLLFGLGLMALLLTADISFGINSSIESTGQQIGSFGITFFLLSLAAIVGLRMFKAEKALQEANANALSAHEQERGRLARDIHDGIGQWLSTIKLNLQLLKSDVEKGKGSSIQRVDELVGDVSHAIEDTRRIAHDLAPAFLEQHGLVVAMQSHADRFSIDRDIDISVEAPQKLDLPETLRNHLYRVFQEALRNAVEHSGGTRINVSLARQTGRLTLTVEDNGIGLDRENEKRVANHLGLKSMTERANLLGGSLDTFTLSGRGTSVVIDVPIR